MRFATLWPTYQKDLAGAASFHGFPTNDTHNPNTPTQPIERVKYLQSPVIAFFGAADRLVPMKDVDDYRRELQAHNKGFEGHTYPGADRGWTNAKGPAYRKEAAKIAGVALSNSCAVTQRRELSWPRLRVVRNNVRRHCIDLTQES